MNGTILKAGVGGALALALGGVWFQSSRTSGVEQQLRATEARMEEMQARMEAAAAKTREHASQEAEKLNASVAEAREAAKASAARAQAEARKQSVQVARALEEKNGELSREIEALKAGAERSSSEVNEKLSGVKSDVGAVRSDVAAAKGDIDRTIADLQRVNGDMGVMSGLIATNAKELEALRRLGERDYFEFTLNKNQPLQRIGSVQLRLTRTDVKRGRFTLVVLADDRTVEKKDKTFNEPVQFYTSSSRLPHEIVVNAIGKDKVSGYLAVPKLKTARAEAGL